MTLQLPHYCLNVIMSLLRLTHFDVFSFYIFDGRYYVYVLLALLRLAHSKAIVFY